MDNKAESDKIDEILPSLWNEGLLTDIECRMIASTQQPGEKIGAAHEIVLSKNMTEAVDLIQKFDDALPAETYKTLLSRINNQICDCDSECNCDFDAESADSDDECESEANCDPECECEVDCKCEDNHPKSTIEAEKNPFLQSVVIDCLFQYLPLNDIKNGRLVCRIWNSAAELVLRKRCTICFSPNLFRPADFLESCKYSSLELPFSSFKFQNYDDYYEYEEGEEDETMWRVLEIENFFDKYGKNIKEIQLVRIALESVVNPGRALRKDDISPWFVKLPNLKNLKIEGAGPELEEFLVQTSLEISLAPLASINAISLENCCILTYANKANTPIAPTSISLTNVRVKQDGKYLSGCSYNDFINFNRVLNVMVNDENRCEFHGAAVTFDMGRHVFKADQLHLLEVDVRNWKNAKGEIYLLHLNECPFTVKNQLQIKQFSLENSKIDLCVLPNTVEKVNLSSATIFCRRPVQLENLKFLYFHVYEHNSQDLLHFGNCANLVQLELISTLGQSSSTIIHLECIPRSVQKCGIDGLQFSFSSHDCNWELDTLILNECRADGPLLIDCQNILTKIKPKNLVLVYSGEFDVDTSDIMKFIVDNEQINNVIIGSRNIRDWDLHKTVPFEDNLMSICVGKKSNYYLFENQIGQAITFNKFKQWTEMSDLDDYFYE